MEFNKRVILCTEFNIFSSPAVDTNDIFGSKRIAVGNFGIRSLALDFSQSYEINPVPGLLGENNQFDKNGPRHVVNRNTDADAIIVKNYFDETTYCNSNSRDNKQLIRVTRNYSV